MLNRNKNIQSLKGTGGHGFDPGRRHTKVVKMVLTAPRFHSDLRGRRGRGRTGRPSVRIMCLDLVSCQVSLCIVLRRGSTIKVSIELPAATGHRRAMTEKQQQQQQQNLNTAQKTNTHSKEQLQEQMSDYVSK